MSVTVNPHLAGLPVYQPGRPIEEVARELGLPTAEIIKMASNENPFGPAPLALAAMEQALRHTHLYPDGNGFYLKNKLSGVFNLPPNQFVLGNGSNEVLELVGHAFLQPGDEVVVSQYCFAVYPIVTALFGGKLVVVPAREYGHDLPAMRRAITSKTRIVFVANPNNPTGTLAARREVMAFLESLPSQVLLVMDEAYTEYMEAPVDLVPLLRSGQHSNLLLARTFSKIYGLAGLRIGYGLGHPEVIGALEKTRQPFNVNLLAQTAALAALDDREHLQRSKANNQAGLRFFEQNLDALGIPYVRSYANFILIKVGQGNAVFQAMQKLGVIVRPMAVYDLAEWVRVSIGTPSENERCFGALKQALGK